MQSFIHFKTKISFAFTYGHLFYLKNIRLKSNRKKCKGFYEQLSEKGYYWIPFEINAAVDMQDKGSWSSLTEFLLWKKETDGGGLLKGLNKCFYSSIKNSNNLKRGDYDYA